MKPVDFRIASTVLEAAEAEGLPCVGMCAFGVFTLCESLDLCSGITPHLHSLCPESLHTFFATATQNSGMCLLDKQHSRSTLCEYAVVSHVLLHKLPCRLFACWSQHQSPNRQASCVCCSLPVGPFFLFLSHAYHA